ncbi:cupredoxin domain-containing protein [Pseudomonas hygromyciniae]|uniref:cupredoxin domain-containing protein n=1 Tax=Pseudomonas hygromyciniae TaxID=2812000 RepID=UPI0023DD8897|nr:cupredoxin domain-containing protein [Pseudomonas hygromyciniae]
MRRALAFFTLLAGGAALAAPLPTYELTLQDGHFNPAQLKVPAGQRFKIVLKNIGQGPAENAWLQLRQHGETVSLSIEDDGRGFSEPVDQREHHGLTIMDERARSLHGQLDISAREPQGTRVHLLFRPEFLGQSLQQGSLS